MTGESRCLIPGLINPIMPAMFRPSPAEMRKPPAGSRRAQFAELLTRHLAEGTRPSTTNREPWTDTEFAGEIPSARTGEFVSPRSVSNWRKGLALPEEIEAILEAL